MTEEENNDTEVVQQPPHDAVADIKKKLKEIDSRKKPPTKKEGVLKSAIKIAKKEASVLDFVFGDSFEADKLADKKQLIVDYPLPTSPKALADFAKYINQEIVAKKKTPDELTPTWKEKLKQVYEFAKAEIKHTDEFSEIKKYYKGYKRRDRHQEIAPLIVMPLMLIPFLFIPAITTQSPGLLYLAVLATGWGIFFALYMFDVMENMIDSIKRHSAKDKSIPRILRIVAWHALIPTLAGLIASIAYLSEGYVWLTGIVFGVEAFFLLIYNVYIYE